jgi:hypothetical protein
MDGPLSFDFRPCGVGLFRERVRARAVPVDVHFTPLQAAYMLAVIYRWYLLGALLQAILVGMAWSLGRSRDERE